MKAIGRMGFVVMFLSLLIASGCRGPEQKGAGPGYGSTHAPVIRFTEKLYAVSIADLVKGYAMAFQSNHPKLEYLPPDRENLASLMIMVKGAGAPGDFDAWVTPTLEACTVRLTLTDHSGPTLKKVIKKVEDWVADNRDQIGTAVFRPVGGVGGILAAANEVIEVKNHQLLIMVLGVDYGLYIISRIRETYAEE